MSPATPNAFGLESSRDMLLKLERDFERLRSSKEHPDVIDHGLTVAMTAWHLADWLWPEIKRSDRRALLAADARVDTNKFKRDHFKSYVLNACPDLRYCQIIATSAKHLRYDPSPQDPKFNTDVAPVEVTWVNNEGQPVTFVNDKGEPVAWTSNAWDLFIIEGGTRKRAAEVFKGALSWWTNFVTQG